MWLIWQSSLGNVHIVVAEGSLIMVRVLDNILVLYNIGIITILYFLLWLFYLLIYIYFQTNLQNGWQFQSTKGSHTFKNAISNSIMNGYRLTINTSDNFIGVYYDLRR